MVPLQPVVYHFDVEVDSMAMATVTAMAMATAIAMAMAVYHDLADLVYLNLNYLLNFCRAKGHHSILYLDPFFKHRFRLRSVVRHPLLLPGYLPLLMHLIINVVFALSCFHLCFLQI